MQIKIIKQSLSFQTFMLKFLEMEKVLFSLAVLNSSQGSQVSRDNVDSDDDDDDDLY